MHVIARRALIEFWASHPDSKKQLEAWYHIVRKAAWRTSADIKAVHKTASILNSERVVFNICGNKYRLIVRINYVSKTVFVRRICTHGEYDRIDAESV